LSERILIIEDEDRMRRILQLILEAEGYMVETAADGEQGIIKWTQFRPSLVFTDIKMPKADGMAVLKYRNLNHPETPVIILTAFGTISAAVEAMKQGAFDYITKPVDNNIIIEKAKEALAKKFSGTHDSGNPELPDLTGSSEIMARIRKELELVAGTRTSVLITGASGTGKELAARTIHLLSPWKTAPFVRINCAAIPGDLMESELFGHVKGAFTGAARDRKGAFLRADTGTLFLDEIGDMPYRLQAKLLHAVEDKKITPVGSSSCIKSEVKIICATNQDIENLIAEKKFRADLYYRLNTYQITMPMLKDRTEDIPELCRHFLDFFSREFKKPAPSLSPEILAELAAYSWPGNVRELKNMMERLMIVSENGYITKDMIQYHSGTHGSSSPAPTSKRTGRDLLYHEKQLIHDALDECAWNISKAARHLGISRNTLRYRIKKHNITAAGQ